MSKKHQDDELLSRMDGLKPASVTTFQPGHPRYGGRKKGSPIKRTREAREIAEGLGFHPIELLAIIALRGVIPNPDGTETPVDADMRLDAIKAAAPFLIPRLSAQQITGPNDGPVEIITPEVEAGMSAIMQDPELCRALQQIALAMAEEEQKHRTGIVQ
jgi:hypothetical protein